MLLAMATADDTQYDFDVALSFAGEDRAYVEELASRLKAGGLRVFLDSDYLVETWGEDLVEYFQGVYHKRSRYAIVFVSKWYVQKDWTRLERRNALARAMEQPTAYVLPARLDDTPLPGLPPTIGYVDCRHVGLDGLARAALAKLLPSARQDESDIVRVPRSVKEEEALLLHRPPGWEYLYLGSVLLRQLNERESAYLDFRAGYVPARGARVASEDIAEFLSREMQVAIRLASNTETLMSEANQVRAFGQPGESGNPDEIFHLASRWSGLYSGFLDWVMNLRSVMVPEKFRQLLDAVAEYASGPIEQYRAFVDELIKELDPLPALIASGEPVVIRLKLTLSIPPEAQLAADREMRRLGVGS